MKNRKKETRSVPVIWKTRALRAEAEAARAQYDFTEAVKRLKLVTEERDGLAEVFDRFDETAQVVGAAINALDTFTAFVRKTVKHQLVHKALGELQ